ncbi:MAG: oligopeptide/dipeptide ABC transporter ATP-binding protein [Burkholderiaceae bacterium]
MTTIRKEPGPLVEVVRAGRSFDVSAPWLNRLLQREGRSILRAVDDVSFTIARGETLGLVGESGCGKSTIARLLVGLYAPTSGDILFDGEPVARFAKSQAMRRRAQMIFQDPYASLNPRWRVGRIIAEPLRLHRAAVVDVAPAVRVSEPVAAKDVADHRIDARVDALLRQVGLSPADKVKYPHQFSGGQRQRISIARALATQPDFLVCDEPTSALDVSVQAQVLNLMKDLQRKLGLTYLFISHNLAVVRYIADRVGVMYLGRLAELAPKTALFAKPLHPYTRMLLDAIPDLEKTGTSRVAVAGEVPNPLRPPSGCTFHPRCPYANARCRIERPELRPHGVAFVACHGVEEERLDYLACDRGVDHTVAA